MHISYWMVLVAALLPVATMGAAKAQKGYDNAQPRAWLTTLQGWRARAEWAHRNHFEAFPPFAAAVIIAQLKGEPQHTIDSLAIAFIALRLAYTAAYIGNVATLRTLIYIGGLGCTLALFVIGGTA
jgi:uncharacterized MAPEG superfamily protein